MMDDENDNESKMAAMKALMNFADEEENKGLASKSPSQSPSLKTGVGSESYMSGIDMKKKEKSGGGMGGMDISSLLSMLGKK